MNKAVLGEKVELLKYKLDFQQLVLEIEELRESKAREAYEQRSGWRRLRQVELSLIQLEYEEAKAKYVALCRKDAKKETGDEG